MENLAYTYETDELITEWHECYISETKNTGMVATLDLSRIASAGPLQFFWSYDSLEKLLDITERETIGKRPYTNVYLSLNAFKAVNGTIKRSTSHLAQIRNIGVDLDCYKLGITPEQCKEKLLDMIAHSKLPNPNLVINSGNGVQLIYTIKGGAAATNPMQWFASYITRELTGHLIELGADFQACTLERVFRLPHTLNKKAGYQTKEVTCELWNMRQWTLQELSDYITPYKPAQKRKKLNREIPLMHFKKGLRTLPQLNAARADDLMKLSYLRGGHIENRNILCYDYAFSLALSSDLSRSELQRAVLQLDSTFTMPQKRNVLRTTVKSAYDDAEKFWRAYAENGYKMQGLDRKLVKPKQNRTIIRQQSITAEEMEELQVIVDRSEIQRRWTQKRRERGDMTMEQYNAKRAEQVDSKIEQLKQLKELHPKASQRKLAEMMGVSQSTIRNLTKQL